MTLQMWSELAAILAVIVTGARLVQLATRLEISSKDATDKLAKQELRLERLEKIPVLERDVAALKEDLSEQRSRVATVWTKLFSHDKHIAVTRAQIRASSPDLSREDEDD